MHKFQHILIGTLPKKRIETDSAEILEVWIVETRTRLSNHRDEETETKVVGVYTNKADAVRNAKVSFTKLMLYEEMYHAKRVNDEITKKLERNGGVLQELKGEEGESHIVHLTRARFNREIKPKTDEMDYDDDYDSFDEEDQDAEEDYQEKMF